MGFKNIFDKKPANSLEDIMEDICEKIEREVIDRFENSNKIHDKKSKKGISKKLYKYTVLTINRLYSLDFDISNQEEFKNLSILYDSTINLQNSFNDFIANYKILSTHNVVKDFIKIDRTIKKRVSEELLDLVFLYPQDSILNNNSANENINKIDPFASLDNFNYTVNNISNSSPFSNETNKKLNFLEEKLNQIESFDLIKLTEDSIITCEDTNYQQELNDNIYESVKNVEKINDTLNSLEKLYKKLENLDNIDNIGIADENDSKEHKQASPIGQNNSINQNPVKNVNLNRELSGKDFIRYRYRELENIYLKENQASMLVPINNENSSLVNDIAYKLNSTVTKSKYTILNKINYAVFNCDGVDQNKIRNEISSFSQVFGDPHKINLFFTPEMVIGAQTKKIQKKDNYMWNLESINFDKAYAMAKGKDVKIAVIDTGVDYNHPELAENFGENKGINFVEGNYDPMDDVDHGTHVAGTLAGQNVGISRKSTLFALKVLGKYGGSEASVVAAIDYCLENGIDVANMSLGGPSVSPAMQEICRLAYQNNLFLFAAAGNDGTFDMPEYPGACDGVFQVAASDFSDKPAHFSNKNDFNDLIAPGVEILSCVLNGDYGIMAGTSMASPHCAGVAGLMKSAFPSLTPIELDELLKQGRLTTNIVDNHKYQGYGKIESYKAVTSALAMKTFG